MEGDRESREILVKRIRSSENYSSFRRITGMKTVNEAQARIILEENIGNLTCEHLNRIMELVDEPYPCHIDGKISRRPWFGRLIKPNALNIFAESERKINQWFGLVSDRQVTAEKRMELLLREPYKIRGLSVGFVSLMFYLLEKDYFIWFRSLHDGLRILYPDLEKFSGRSVQYPVYNSACKRFSSEYGFDHAEMDWVLSTGVWKC